MLNLSKRRGATATFRVSPLWEKQANNVISRVLVGSSRSVSSASHLVMIDYPLLNQFWIMFGDLYSLQYLRSAANQEKYNKCIKYFHNCLSLIIWDLHLPEIEVLFGITASAWLSIVDENIQKNIQESFESVYDWANEEIVKKIVAYSNMWSILPISTAFEDTWRLAK